MSCANDTIFEAIKEFETVLDGGLHLFYKYSVVNKSEITNLLDNIEKSLPEDIIKTKHQLIRENKEKVYKNIEEMRTILERSFVMLSNYVVIDKSEFYSIVDKLYANLPEEVMEARRILKS